MSSIVMKMMFDKLEKEHPVIKKDSCINVIHKKKICDICNRSCSENVFEGSTIHFEKCINCNICSANCPAQAIIPAESYQYKMERLIKTKQEIIYVCCERKQDSGDVNITCLRTFPWEVFNN